jgi:hypothetical protein
MPQIQSQLGLVIHPTPINQHLSWQQFVTPLIVRQHVVISHPSYIMWYTIVPPFVPMDPNMYFMYYSGIKGFDPLLFGRKEKYVANTSTQN